MSSESIAKAIRRLSPTEYDFFTQQSPMTMQESFELILNENNKVDGQKTTQILLGCLSRSTNAVFFVHVVY